jgi:hypothetical protein
MDAPLPAFAAGTHFSMSWVRLPGAESCVTSRELSRAVESRLHRPALGAPAETDVAIDGYVEALPEGGFHAVVTITDPRGKLVGKRELDGKSANCREMDAPLALTIALMIDPDAAFAATAEPARPPRAVPLESPPRREPPLRATRAGEPELRATAVAGGVIGFGVLPGTAEGAWVGAAIAPRALFPIELVGYYWLEQSVPIDGVKVAFSRATLGLLGCPLEARIEMFRFGACAGINAGMLTAIGNKNDGLFDERRWIVDANLRGRVDWFFLPNVALRVTAALAIPFIRDSFMYQRIGGRHPGEFLALRLPSAGGDVGFGIAVQVP